MTETDLRDVIASFPDERARALYQHGLDRQWNVDRALDWSALRLDRVPITARRGMACLYSDTLHAEKFGLELGARIAELAPAGWLRDFTLLQLRDEVRHVDFFGRVVGKLGEGDAISDELVCIRSELLTVTTHEELMLHALILECGARATFVGNAKRSLDMVGKGVRLPANESISTLMRAIVDYVGRDEARHIAMGMCCLRTSLQGPRVSELRSIERRLRVTATLFLRSLLHRSDTFARLGLSPDTIGTSVWQAIRSQLQRLDLDIGDPDSAPPSAST